MDAVDRMVGETIIGTKIAAKPGAEVVYTTLHAGRAFISPARIPRALVPSQYMECEISFRLTRDLPPRAAAYSEPEVFDALEAAPRSRRSIAASRTSPPPWRSRRTISTPTTSPPARWCSANSARTGRSSISPRPRCRSSRAHAPSSRKCGGHPTGNPAIPAVVLANLRRTTTGLKAGWIVVTGSFTGFHPVALNEPVRGEFEGFGTMEATIVG